MDSEIFVVFLVGFPICCYIHFGAVHIKQIDAPCQLFLFALSLLFFSSCDKQMFYCSYCNCFITTLSRFSIRHKYFTSTAEVQDNLWSEFSWVCFLP
jgi:hypothetical protein